jgi:hypothetical protein
VALVKDKDSQSLTIFTCAAVTGAGVVAATEVSFIFSFVQENKVVAKTTTAVAKIEFWFIKIIFLVID